MTAPDFISPITGYRVWQWDGGLKSLNGIQWQPRRALASVCRAQRSHEGPHIECTCGVYASKSLEHLRRQNYTDRRIHGEVSLWGTVVEHEQGWRAQFAYPRNLVVPLAIVPLSMSRLELWLQSLASYGCEIFIQGDSGTVPLWRGNSGVEADGIELLIGRCKAWYARRAEERRIKPGDRVSVIGHGVAIVEYAHSHLVRAVLGNKKVLRIERERIVWREQYSRWETAAGATAGLTTSKERQPSA